MKSNDVNVTQLRADLPPFLKRVENGEPLRITSRGKVIARLLPPGDARMEARTQLDAWSKDAHSSDVLSPVDAPWDAER